MNMELNKIKPESTQHEAAIAELTSITAPLVEWIRNHHDPHTELHISWDRVCLKHDGISIPFPYSE